MRLRSLEIQGFKSFPDKTTLQFVDGVTAVVGPNGSGKSNIADAVRWVLGEQSTKTLRGGKMEDVIFGGTQTRKAVGYASVQLTMDNADRTLPVEEDTVAIARKLYRSGESEYRLNGAMVRLKDIHEMLMDTGLGRDGYSIIGQGRIAEIVSNKSSQRREIFEEAAGIAKFRYRKDEAERRLLQAEENLLRLRDILVELEDRVGPLKIQAEKAKAFLVLSEEKRGLEVSLWMLSLETLRARLSQQQDRLDLCKNQYEQAQGEGAAMEEAIGALYQRIQQLGVAIDQKRADIRAVEDGVAKGDAEAAVKENDIRHNHRSIERVEGELATAGQGADELRAQIAEKEQSLAQGEEALDAMRSRLAAAEQRLAEQREQSEKVAQELAALSARSLSLSDALGDAKLSKTQSTALIAEGKNRAETLRENSGEVDQAARELQESIEECETQTRECEEQINAVGNMQKGYALKRESRAKKREKLQEQQKGLQDQAAQKLQRARLLEDLEINMEGYAGSVKYILGEAKKGALSGVHGAISSLIDADPQYAVAVETALGGAMQNIVVDDEDAAGRAIRALQSAKAGRATFLPLTSVKGGRDLDAAALSGREGFLGTADRLVRCDPKFSRIVSQLLGRVAVVEDLDAGTKMAKANGYRFRIVTLDGQLINAGGSFTGGSVGRSAGVLGRRHEIEKLRDQAQTLQEQARALDPELKAAGEELAGIDAYLAGAAGELQTAQEERVRLGFQKETLARSLEQAQRNRANAERELAELLNRLAELEGSDLDAEKLIETLDAEREGIRRQIEGAEARRDTLSVGAETAAQQLAEQRMAHFEARKEQDLLAQEIQRLQEQAATAGTRGAQLAAEKEELLAQNRRIAEEIERIRENKTQLQAKAESMSATVADFLKQRTELEGETTALRAKEREASAERERVSRELARLEERRSNLQSEYDGIIAKLWDEYELTRSKAAELAEPLADPEAAARRLTELRGKIKAIGSVNVDAVEEYLQVSERYEFLSEQIGDAQESKEKLHKLIVQLTEDMRERFSESFSQIAGHFSQIFAQLFGGGRAELALAEGDVLEAGVEISVQPPGKVIKNLSLLSGGEQAFVAIAIYFAILKVRPAPFCLLDEIEAALDDVNVVKFASYLRQMCKNTQFIAITHRRGTMEEADVLYGVTMQDEGVSKLLELNVSEVEAKLGL